MPKNIFLKKCAKFLYFYLPRTMLWRLTAASQGSGLRSKAYTPIEDKFLHAHGLYTHAGEKRIELSVVRR